MRRCVETAIMTSNSSKLKMPELQTTNCSGSEKDPDELPPTQVFPAAKRGIDDKEKVVERNGKIADKQEKNTSDEEFIDIRPNVRVKKADFTTEKIESLIVKCTACRNQINHHDSHRVKKHPHLGVVICKECLEFYDTGEFSQDDDGDKYCRWCAQGGTLYSCDFCNNTFCNECVRYNFGRGEVRRIKEQKWKCYICEPEKMDGKVKFCELLCQYSKGKTLKRKPNKTFRSNNVVDNDNDDSGSPLKFIPKFLSEAIRIADEFKVHVQKLNQKLDSNAKSPKQLLRKFEQLISILRSNTKDTLIEANEMYNSYIKDRTSRLVSDSSSSTVKLQGDIPNTVDSLINNVANHFGEKLMTNQHLDNELDETRSVSSDRLNTTESINNSGENLEPAADIKSDSKHSSFVVKENLELNSSECKSGKSLSPDVKPALPIKKESARKQFVKTESLVKKSKGKELVITLTSSSSELDFSEKPKIVKKSNSNDETIQSDKDIQSNILSTKSLVSNRTSSTETLKNEEIESKAPLSSDKKGKATKDGHLRLLSSSSPASSNTSSLESTAETDGETKKRVRRKKKPVSKKKPTFTKDEVAQWNDEKQEKLKDEKLQMKAVVELCRLGIPQEQIEAALRPIEKSKKKTSLTAMERSVQRLLNEPLKRKRSVTSDDHEEGFKPACKKKSTKTTTTADSSDSDALSLASFSDSNPSSKAPAVINTTMNTSDIKPFSRLFHNSETDDDDSSSGRDLEEMSKNEKSLLKSTKKKAEPSDLEDSDNSVVSVKSIKDDDSDDDFCAPRKVSKKDDKLIKKANSAIGNEKDDEKSEGKGEKGKSKAKEKKKGKRRKIIYSDDSGTSDSSDSRNESAEDSDFEDSKKKKKGRGNKRKRIKIDNSSDEDDEDPGSQSTPGKGRKNIRKVISEKSLEQETIEAQMMEKERRKRLQDRQKLYNQITDTAEDGKEIITRKMVLEIDPDSKEEVVQIHPDIIEKLKPHQVNGVKFMWEATIESLKLLETKPGSGCILAHCMGLGKTLQVIAFLYTLLTNKYTNKKLRTAMIVCPNNTVMNWAKEFDYWLADGIDVVNVFEMVMIKDYHSRLELLKNWQKDGGVLILGYDIFARLVEGKIPKKNKEFKNKVFTRIADPGADIVVCDEGHKLKNEKSLLSRCANKLRTQRRIVLTGTPLQNNLKEYYCMMNFVKPRLLGTFKEFTNRFVNPIVNGQYDDSSKHDVKLMKKRVHILHKLLEGCVQRCDYSALTHFLPPKHEFVISVKLSEVQIKLYQCYLDQNSRVGNNEYGEQKVDGRKLFPDYSMLKNVWTFPYALQLNYQRLERQRILKGDDDVDDDGNLKNFVDDGSLSGNSSTSSDNDDELTCLDDEPQPGPSRRKTRNMKAQENDSSGDEVIKKYPRPEAENLASDDDILLGEKQWFHQFISQEDQFKAELSGKITLTLEILKECESIGDKVLIFSTSLITLDIIEMFLKHINDQPITTESVADESRDISHTWVPEIDYFRMDGKCPVEIRERYMTKFNQKDNIRARLMLISTKAGSLGTNLVGANRVILLDASWNPSDDVQSIFRVYRFGQVKPVYIYRFLAQGTMEEKIYNRQVTKLSMSCRVVDEQNIDRHFNASQLSELYTFEPDTREERPTLMVPKDRLLADLIITHKEWIVTYFEHDSLLQHTKEDDLTEEERQAAWTEYENEKEGIFMNNNIEYAASAGPGLHAINMATMVKNFTNEIIRNKPSINQFELKSTLVTNMTKFKYQMQREHTALLRKKQESVSFGLPASVDVNQALENLQVAMRHCDSYITQIKRAILTDMQNIRQQHHQQQQHARFNTAQAFQNAGHSAGIRVGDAAFQQRFMQSRPAFMAQNVTRFQNMVPPATFRFGYARVPTPPSSGPTIVDITEEEKSSERESHNDSPIVTFNEEPPEPKKAPSSSAHSVKITEVE